MFSSPKKKRKKGKKRRFGEVIQLGFVIGIRIENMGCKSCIGLERLSVVYMEKCLSRNPNYDCINNPTTTERACASQALLKGTVAANRPTR